MINIEDKRGSGRTTRMLFDAVQTAYLTGERVMVVAATTSHAQCIAKQLHDMFAHDMLVNVGITCVGAPKVQRRNGVFLVDGIAPERTFVDHYVYYVELQRLSALFKGFHKYD